MQKSFYSHGKLLLTSEYLVLDSVPALALPTKKGQWLFVKETDSELVKWKSYTEDNQCWFETSITLPLDMASQAEASTYGEHSSIHNTLVEILKVAQQLNPSFLTSGKGYEIETRLEFDQKWGLGSSSTLINNIAQWAKVDAFELLQQSFGGSGYDIASAQHDTPILYTRTENKPIVEEIQFAPIYKDKLHFIYLNQKQNSKDSIKHYQSLPLKDFDNAAAQIKEITSQIIACASIAEFETLINTHEEVISKIIKTPTVKSKLFSDYSRSIKSLGGWGGDFVLVTGTTEEMNYFKEKGYHTIIPYSEMIL